MSKSLSYATLIVLFVCSILLSTVSGNIIYLNHMHVHVHTLNHMTLYIYVYIHLNHTLHVQVNVHVHGIFFHHPSSATVRLSCTATSTCLTLPTWTLSPPSVTSSRTSVSLERHRRLTGSWRSLPVVTVRPTPSKVSLPARTRPMCLLTPSLC